MTKQFKVFTSAVLTAADVNDYLMEQAVIVCQSTDRPTAQDGMVIKETDTDRILMYDGTGWIILYEPPQSWTPTYTNVTTTTGTHDAYYQRSNGMCKFRATFTLGASSAVTGAIIITAPITALATADFHGMPVQFTDATVNNYPGIAIGTATTTFRLDAINAAGTYAVQTASSGTIPFTWGSGDYWTVTGAYRMTTLYS